MSRWKVVFLPPTSNVVVSGAAARAAEKVKNTPRIRAEFFMGLMLAENKTARRDFCPGGRRIFITDSLDGRFSCALFELYSNRSLFRALFL